MKKTNLLAGTAALMALALTACSNDLNVDNPHLNEADGIRYLKVAIANTPGTRADETYPGDGDGNATFDSGSVAENKVSSLYFKFYDINGKILEDYDSNNNLLEYFNWTDKTGTTTPNVGKIGEAVIELSLTKGSPKPAYVIAFLNPVDFDDMDDHDNMQDLRATKRPGFKSNGGDFAMSNSAYYGPAGIPDAQKTKIMATSISEDMLYTTKAEAEKENAKSVDIYVERYAAKVTVSIKNEASKPIPIDGYTFTFKPEAWTVNADAPTMYVSKRFENSNSEDHLIPTYDDVQEMLGDWTSWNDATNHRSYWACSPSYYDTDFPNVSDNIIDRVENGTGAGIAVPPYDLRYYSYNQITDQKETNISDGKGITSFSDSGTNWKYVLENTMGEAAFKCLNPKAAAPSVVIVGKYEIAKNGTKIENIGQGFCIYNNNKIYWRGTIPTGANEGDETILKHLMDENQVLFTVQRYDEGNNPVYGLLKYDENIADFFDVVHPKKDVRGEQNVPHRYVTLQLKSKTDLTEQQQTQQKEKLSTLYYKPVGSNSYIPLATDESTDVQVADIITKINKQLWAQLGNARAYNTAKGYFSIPIQHLGMTENNVNNPYDVKNEEGTIIRTNTLDWKKVRVGDFGLVRNHAYKIEVEEISGWANGIEDLDNPLVPSMDDDNYWIKYKINILNWRVVPAQTGIVLK